MDNVILWSGNHIGHRATIREGAFLSSHVAVSGYCEIGENCFLGVNSCVGDNMKIARDCIIGAGAVVIADTEEGKVYVGNPAKPTRRSSYATLGSRTPKIEWARINQTVYAVTITNSTSTTRQTGNPHLA